MNRAATVARKTLRAQERDRRPVKVSANTAASGFEFRAFLRLGSAKRVRGRRRHIARLLPGLPGETLLCRGLPHQFDLLLELQLLLPHARFSRVKIHDSKCVSAGGKPQQYGRGQQQTSRGFDQRRQRQRKTRKQENAGNRRQDGIEDAGQHLAAAKNCDGWKEDCKKIFHAGRRRPTPQGLVIAAGCEPHWHHRWFRQCPD